jgi:hypothetical protein
MDRQFLAARLALIAALLHSPGCIRYDEPPADAAPSRGVEAKPEKQRVEAKQLRTLGYVDGTVDPEIERAGVIRHQREAVFEGYNFYTSRNQQRAQLIDMEGNVVHVWEGGNTGAWQHATLLPDGDVVVLVKDKRVLRVDKDSKVLWTLDERVHHDLWVDPRGEIYVLGRRRVERDYHRTLPSVEDYVAIVSPEGEVRHRVSILAAIENSPYAFLLGRGDALPAREFIRPNPRPDEEFDLLHTNHVEVMDGRFAERGRVFAEGNLLVSPRNLQAVLVIHPQTAEIVWIWGPNNLIYPHHPTVTDDGHILVFNNGQAATGSQVLEIDPITDRIVWTYGPVEDFFSVERGSNQRLPNGNTLITESDTGYVFEVTRDGDVVWTFVNPHVKAESKLRMAIWRMSRHAPESLQFEFNRSLRRGE